METLLRIGLSNAVAALLLALLVVTVACIWRRPAVLHALWLLVLVKLVTPPLVWLPEPWTDSASGRREPADAAPLAEPTAPPPRADAPGSPVVADVPSAGSRRPLAEDAPADLPQEAVFVTADVEAAPTPAPVPVAPQAPAAPWWLAVVFGLWLAGALGWFALALVRLWRFRRSAAARRPGAGIAAPANAAPGREAAAAPPAGRMVGARPHRPHAVGGGRVATHPLPVRAARPDDDGTAERPPRP